MVDLEQLIELDIRVMIYMVYIPEHSVMIW